MRSRSGDRIEVGHYTATCQALPGEGLALFLLDQYLDKAMQMNKKNTSKAATTPAISGRS